MSVKRAIQVIEAKGRSHQPQRAPVTMAGILDDDSVKTPVGTQPSRIAALDIGEPIQRPAVAYIETLHGLSQQVTCMGVAIVRVDGDDGGRGKIAVLVRAKCIVAIDVEGQPIDQAWTADLKVPIPQRDVSPSDQNTAGNVIGTIWSRRDQLPEAVMRGQEALFDCRKHRTPVAGLQSGTISRAWIRRAEAASLRRRPFGGRSFHINASPRTGRHRAVFLIWRSAIVAAVQAQ